MTKLEKKELRRCVVCCGPLTTHHHDYCSSPCYYVGMPIPLEDLGMLNKDRIVWARMPIINPTVYTYSRYKEERIGDDSIENQLIDLEHQIAEMEVR